MLSNTELIARLFFFLPFIDLKYALCYSYVVLKPRDCRVYLICMQYIPTQQTTTMADMNMSGFRKMDLVCGVHEGCDLLPIYCADCDCPLATV